MIVVGLIVGAIARLLVPGPDPIGIIGTILVGIAGGLVGGFLWAALFSMQVGWSGSIIGAVIVLLIYRAYQRRGGRRRPLSA